jgi:hypothetical protein
MLTDKQVRDLRKEYANDLKRRRYINELRKGEVTPEIQDRINALLYKGVCAYVHCKQTFYSEFRSKRFCSAACRNCYHVMQHYRKTQAAKQVAKAAA